MSEINVPLDPRRPGRNAVEVRVPALMSNLAMLRSLVGAIGAFEDLDVDAVADLRLAVDEVGTQLIRSATEESRLVVVVEPDDTGLVVTVSAECDADHALTPGSFSWHVLTALADDVRAFAEDGSRVGPLGAGGADGDTSRDDRMVGISLTARRSSSR